MAGILIFSLLFIIPFFVFPFGNFQFEPPKVILSWILVETLFLVVAFKYGKKFFKSLNRTHLSLIGAVVAVSIYHLLAFPSPITFFGNEFRLQGVFLLWHLLLFSLISSRIRLPNVAWYWYGFFLFVTFVLSLFISNQNVRAVATLGEPNALSAFVIFLWPFLFFAKFPSKKLRIYVSILSLISALGIIFLSSSRSGLIAFLMQIVFIMLLYRMKLPLKKVIFVISICIGIAYTLPFFEKLPYENRLDVWRTSLISGLEHPILGAGFGNAELAIHRTSLALQDKLVGHYVDSAHNIFIDWWIQMGSVGVITLFLLLCIVVRNFYKEKRKVELLILLGLFIMLSFNPGSIVALLGLWWIVGRGFANTS